MLRHLLVLSTAVNQLDSGDNGQCRGDDKGQWYIDDQETKFLYRCFPQTLFPAGTCPRVHHSGNGIEPVPCIGEKCPEEPYHDWARFDGCYPEGMTPGTIPLSSTDIITTEQPNVPTNEPPKCTNDSNSTFTIFLIFVLAVVIVLTAVVTAVVTVRYPQHRIIQIISCSFLKGRNGNTDENIAAEEQRPDEPQQQETESSMDDEEDTNDMDLRHNAVDKLLGRGSNQKSETRIPIGPLHGQPQDDVALSSRTGQ